MCGWAENFRVTLGICPAVDSTTTTKSSPVPAICLGKYYLEIYDRRLKIAIIKRSYILYILKFFTKQNKVQIAYLFLLFSYIF